MHFLRYHKESNVCIMSLSLFQDFFWIPPKYSVHILYCICTMVTKIYLFNNHIIDVEWLDGKQETQGNRGVRDNIIKVLGSEVHTTKVYIHPVLL